jgi:hypothetical protein
MPILANLKGWMSKVKAPISGNNFQPPVTGTVKPTVNFPQGATQPYSTTQANANATALNQLVGAANTTPNGNPNL